MNQIPAQMAMACIFSMALASCSEEPRDPGRSEWQPHNNISIPAVDVERFGIGSYAIEAKGLPIEFALWKVQAGGVEPLQVSVRIKAEATDEVDKFSSTSPAQDGSGLSAYAYERPFGDLISWRRDLERRGMPEVLGAKNFRYFCPMEPKGRPCHLFVEVQNIELATLIERSDRGHIPTIAERLTGIVTGWILPSS